VVALEVLVVAMHSFWGFVQDDAYISLRYACNLAAGNGLVFNPGERVEGFTNLSWTLLGALCCALGLPTLHVVCFAGAAAALALVALLWVEAGGTFFMTDGALALTAGLGAWLLASNATLAAWSVSGLEQTFFTLLVFAGYYCFVRHRDRSAAALWLVATATRPEGALAFGLGAVVRAAALIWTRKRPSRKELAAAALYAGGLSLLLAFRLAYYGDIVPNTYYVKGTANAFTHRQGLVALGDFLAFGAFGAVLPVAFAGLASNAWIPSRGVAGRPGPSDRQAIAFSALFLVSFLYYMVRIGGDQLPLFRLYMSILPFAVLWAVRAVHWTWGRGLRLRSVGRLASLALVATLAVVSVEGIRATRQHAAYRTANQALQACHGAAGRFLEEQARRGPPGRPLTVLAQDMGLTPYLAPRVRFVDVVGLTDRTVATTLYRYDYNAYTRRLMWTDPVRREQIWAMDRELRAYLRSRMADYVLINIYCEPRESQAIRAAYARRDALYFRGHTGNNMFYYGLPAQPEFLREFELVKGYEYTPVHFMLLYQRRAAPPESAANGPPGGGPD
jgi:arabinofuranosyltransferase